LALCQQPNRRPRAPNDTVIAYVVAGAAVVPAYRVYFIDRAGHVSRPPQIVECADDQEAAQKAKQLVDGQDVEVWDGPRFVIGLKSKGSK
jgi:predicted dinucleotide-binding enzyme